MKKDKLEQFVSKNRQAFDDLEPDPAAWEGVRQELKARKGIHWKMIMWRAAAVVIIFTASYFFHDLVNQNNGQSDIAAVDEQTDPASMEAAKTFIEAEAYYTSRIGNKTNEFYALAGPNSPIVKEINMEFKQLDQVLIELKNDLGDNAANNEVIEAMIQNYRMKLMILEEMLVQLRESQITKEEAKNEDYEL